MSTLYRIMVILVVAAIIGGAIFAMVGSGSSSSQPAGGRPAGESFRPEGGEEREGGSGLPFGMVKSLALMSVAGGVYLAGEKLFNKKRQKAVTA